VAALHCEQTALPLEPEVWHPGPAVEPDRIADRGYGCVALVVYGVPFWLETLLNCEAVVAATVAVLKFPLGSVCYATSMCNTSGAECRGHRCICSPGFYRLDDGCSTCLVNGESRSEAGGHNPLLPASLSRSVLFPFPPFFYPSYVFCTPHVSPFPLPFSFFPSSQVRFTFPHLGGLWELCVV